jgi:hypothetical protein
MKYQGCLTTRRANQSGLTSSSSFIHSSKLGDDKFSQIAPKHGWDSVFWQTRNLATQLFCIVSIVLILLLCNSAELSAQQTTRGRDFYFTFIPNFHNFNQGTPTDSLYVFVTADTVTTGTLTYRNRQGQLFNININITNPAVIWSHAVPFTDFELLGFNQGGNFSSNNDLEKAASQVFRVQTNRDVGVYALNKAGLTSDASLILPTPTIGNEYFIMAYRSDGVASGGIPESQYTPSQFAIVGTEDNTQVTIVPTAPTTETGSNTKTITINRGEVFLYQAEFSVTQLRYDLTGTRITSSKPISVFGGHQRATVPVQFKGQLLSRDQLYEQLLPTNVWGRIYVITPLAQPIGVRTVAGTDLWRVVAAEDGTVLRFNNSTVATLNRGQFYEASLNQAGLLVASKKVMVAFIKKTHSDNPTTEIGDPFMMIIPPRRQYLNSYRFTNIPLQSFVQQFMTVVTTRNNTGNITYDGSRLTATFEDIPNSCFAYANVRVNGGSHTISSPQPVGLYVYGYGDADSYGYVGGMAFIPDVEDVQIDAGADRTICAGDTVRLRASGAVSNIRWTPRTGLSCDTCAVTVANPRVTTTYVVSATDSLGCDDRDTVVVFVREYRIDAQKDTSVCAGADSVTISVRGLNGTIRSVRWSPNVFVACDTCATTKIQPPTVTTRFIATATDSLGCVGRDTVTITILPPIVVDAGPDLEYCNPNDSLTLRVTGRNIRSVRWSPSVGLACDTCITTRVKPSVITYRVTVRDASGCEGTDSMSIRLRSSTTPIRNNGNQSICFKNDSAQLIVTGNFRSIKWTPSTELRCDTCRITFSTTKENRTYYYNIVDANGCESRDSIKINVLPPAQVNAEPDTIICASTAVLIRADGSFQSINWTPPIGLSCSSCNTTLATPPKRDITYYAVARNGNSKDCEAIDSVRIKYARGIEDQIPSKASLCLGDSVTLSIVYGGSVRWTPRTGLKCDTCKQVVLKPTVTTRYVVQGDSLGCLSRDTIDITVVPAVTVNATADTSICEGKSVELRANTNSFQVSWVPATGLSCTGCPNPTASPTTSTRYIVTVGSGACSKTDTVNVLVKARPVVGVIPSDTSICAGEDVQYDLVPPPPSTWRIEWSPPTNLSATNIRNPRATGVKENIQYSVRVVGENTCDTVITTTITIQPTPTFAIANADTAVCAGSSVRVRMTGDTTAKLIWTPTSGLSCTDCPTPTITADSSRRYIVRTQASGSCQKSDTLTITVNPRPSVAVSALPRDTVCLNARNVSFSASGGGAGATYSWTPPTRLSNPNVANPEFTQTAVAGTYSYTVTVTSREGCVSSAQTSITIVPCSLSITLTADPSLQTPRISCDSLSSWVTVSNDGDVVVTIDSISLVGGVQQGATLDLDSLRKTNAQFFPMVLQPKESKKIPIVIVPTITGNYSIDVVVYFGGKPQILKVSGQTLRRDLRLKLFGSETEFNRNFSLPVYAESQYWNELKVNDVSLTILYDQLRMEYLGDTSVKISPALQNTWRATVVPGSFQLGKVSVSLQSISPSTILNKDDTLMYIGFRPLLPDSRTMVTQPTLQYTLPNKRLDCFNNLNQSFPVSILVCAADIRAVRFSDTPFMLTSIAPNPSNSTLTIQYGIGFESQTELKLYDINGRTISTLYSGVHKGGLFEAVVDVSSLAEGVYYCTLTSAGNTFTKQLRIVR